MGVVTLESIVGGMLRVCVRVDVRVCPLRGHHLLRAVAGQFDALLQKRRHTLTAVDAHGWTRRWTGNKRETYKQEREG